ncbi:MAG: methyltransferase domain-containing protein [Phycisphaerales bacterium]
MQDFYFAKNWLRIKHSACEVPDTEDTAEHLRAWQNPAVLYQLLHLVYKETVTDEFDVVELLRRHGPKQCRHLVEYGCAIAPVTSTLFEFTRPSRDVRITIADIQTIAFHYGVWRFRRCANVVPRLLGPENGFQLALSEPQDAITCITVAEHLNAPLQTFQTFHRLLRQGGILVFDYIKTDGGSMDTMHAARQRESVLAFVAQHFDIVHGNLDPEASMGLTVARKR